MTPVIARKRMPARSPARTAGRATAIGFAALALACGGAQAQPHGYYRGGWGPGPFWGGLGLALGFGLAYDYARPNYVVVDPPPVYYTPPQPVVVYQQAPAAQTTTVVAAAAVAVDPIFYPRNGQSAQQTEADRQVCNSWASTQPKAMADASIFQRATLACMDGRGYTSR